MRTIAREAMVAHLGGNNTPEYISEDSSEIAIDDVIFGVRTEPYGDELNTWSVSIETAE